MTKDLLFYEEIPVLYDTYIDLDIEGNEKSILDARGNAVMSYKYGIHGEKLNTTSMDAGESYLLLSLDEKPICTWNFKNNKTRVNYDALRRPTEQILTEDYTVTTPVEKMISKVVYGESISTPKANNLRGQAVKSYDQSGLNEVIKYDFKGNVLESQRQLAQEYKTVVDVSIATNLLETEIFTTEMQYDALNRAVSIKTPYHKTIPTTGVNPILANEVLPTYNEANFLEAVDVKLRGSATATSFVINIDYDAKGQREKIEYANGVKTEYTYDPNTFRLKNLVSTKSNDDELQNLSYDYDFVGNITSITDASIQTLFYNGQVVNASQTFQYDDLYRLINSSGREHIGQVSASVPEYDGNPAFNPPTVAPSVGGAMRNYTRGYEYDEVGNIMAMIHNANNNTWTRNYSYASDSNRLNSTTIGSTTVNYNYNEHGSMAKMSHLNAMDWNYAEHLSHVTRGTTEAYYTYDGSGERVRKVVEKLAIREERLYLSGFEIYRKYNGSTIELERETLHVSDDAKKIALVETKTVDTSANNGIGLSAPVQVVRYQLDNHLGSSSVELSVNAEVISYEEYYPYGESSFRSPESGDFSHKRYRYTGKEKDEESGLYYLGARYYAAWLGRWTAADPAGLVDGVNLYMYVQGNPVKLVDKTGNGSEGEDSDKNVRLILYTESMKKADENTFEAAAKNIEKDYRKYYSDEDTKIVVKKVATGKEIVDIINAQKKDSIVSLDIVSHANTGGIHIARGLKKPVKSGFLQKMAHVKIRATSDRPQSEDDASMIEESMHGLYSGYAAKKIVSYYYNQSFEIKTGDGGKNIENNDTAFLSEIEFDRFSKESPFIEFHGCLSTQDYDATKYVYDSFAENFSDNVPNATVVGHTTKSTPDYAGNGYTNDYRHKKVNAYKGGNIVQKEVKREDTKFLNSSTPKKGSK